MTGIKHHTTTENANDPEYDVSATAWEEEHDIDDAGIPQAKIAADIQVIAGPAWSTPSGSGPFAIQYNTSLDLSRLCWYNGTVWDYAWGGNCRIEEFEVLSGTVGIRDCFAIGTSRTGTEIPAGTRGTQDYNLGSGTLGPRYVGICLGNAGSGETVPVLVAGRILMYGGGMITAGLAVSGADGSARPLAKADQAINEAGSGSYKIYYSRRIGVALTRCAGPGSPFWLLVAP